MSNALRHGLHIDHGQRVCILAENSLEYFELFHSTGAIGAITVPLNQRLALDELEAIGSQVEPRAIFYGSTFDEEAERLGTLFGAEPISIESSSKHRSYDDLLAQGSEQREGPGPQPSDASSICFTGGTTGQPKGVVISHRALIANAQIVSEAHGMIGRDRHIFVRPMAVAPGHRMAAWHGYSGGTTIISTRFEPLEFFRLVEAERATVSLLSPTMFQMLLDSGNPEHRDLTSFRSAAYGGAPITPALLAEVLDAFDCEFHQSYGGTEAANATHLSAQDHLDGRLDSVGREIRGVTTRIVDADGRDVPTGSPGELLVSSEQILTEYWQNPVATAEVLREGFYWTGDIAVRQSDGYMSIVGRTKDMIISGGFNVYPVEVENVLAAHPGVRDVAIIGVPHQLWGEAVHAVVVLRPGENVSSDELIGFCRSRIASYKKPQSVEFVSELPRTSIGKVAKNALRENAHIDNE